MAMAAIIFLLLISFSAAVTASTTVFDFKLVHRDSPRSPLYNSSLTPFDRVHAAALRSVQRADYLTSRISAKTSLNLDLGLSYAGAEFLMVYSIGTPNPQSLFGVLDTGSDLNWVNCIGCQCFNKTRDFFDSSASLSYRPVNCHSDECTSFEQGRCSDVGEMCQYHFAYGDGSNIDGNLATETFRFYSLDTYNYSFIPNLTFGCNFRSLFTVVNDPGSIIGLGPRPPSLIFQLAPKYINKYFSHCFSSWVDGGEDSRLFLGGGGGGDAAIPENATVTPLMPYDGYYAVLLNSISIPGRFTINTRTTPSDLDAGNIIFDSGTMATMLDPEVVDELESELRSLIKLPVAEPQGLAKLCYYVRAAELEDELPALWFSFGGSLGEFRVRPESLFLRVAESVKCLAILPAAGKLQIFGHLMQQNVMVGYDLTKLDLILVEKNCSTL